jgi:hypothetical protein
MEKLIEERSFGSGRLMILGGAILAAAMIPSIVLGQSGAPSIDPGMTQQEVISRLGPPDEQGVAGFYSYFYYDNDCGKKCGMDDLVVLEKGIVVDAIFRSKNRVFTGVSSSPHDLPPVPAAHYTPEPLRAANHEDSAHQGGIVFAEPRAPLHAPQYVTIVPNRADSAKMASKVDSQAPH